MDIGALRVFGRWAAAVLLLLLVAGVRAQGEIPARVGRIAAVSGEVLLFDAEAQRMGGRHPQPAVRPG